MPLYRVLTLLGLLAIAIPTFAAKGTYVYTDEDGNKVYSQFPPPAGTESRTVKPPPPPAETPEEARQRLQDRQQLLEDVREDRQLEADKQAEADQEKERAAKNCEAARQNLQNLSGNARRLFRNSDGTYSRMTDEEHQTKRAEAEKIIAEDCK